MDLIKYDMTNIWAVAGDVVQPDSAKIRAGWGVEVVPRQWWNWFENRQDNNIAYMLQKGFPEWDATTEYIINKSYVQRSGVVYKATATNTNSDPIVLTSWVRAFADYSVATAALGALTPATDKLPYFNGTSTADLTTITAFARSVLDDADAVTVRGTINAQQSNANLDALSGITGVANALPYFTGTTTMGITTLTLFGRSLIDDADAAAARLTLGLGTVATSNITTSRYDTTVGSVLKVGDFGLGQTTAAPVADANTVVASGFYTINNATLNIPAGSGAGGTMVHTTWDVNTNQQIVLQNNRMWQRQGGAGVWTAWVESWTSSNLVKTTSISDSTAGRMLKVGDFGIGAQGVLVGDINALSNTGTGFYKLGSPYTGSPLASQPCTVIHQAYDNERTQIAIPEGNGSQRMFFRKYTAGAWTSWVEVYHTGNTQTIVDQVTTGIQPTLDGKVSKSGDTITGSLSTASLEVGLNNGVGGFLDFHSSAAASDYHGRIFASGGSSTVNSGTMNYTGAAHVFTGPITGTISTANSLTGNIPISQVTSLQATLDAKMPLSGSGAPTFAGLRVNSGISAAQGQGGYLLWNETGVGATSMINNQGGGTGGFIFRNVNTANTVETGRIVFGGNGSIACQVQLNVGAGIFSPDGNCYGTIWGGWLSNWLSTNIVYKTSLRQDSVTYLTVGEIGSIAFCYTSVGATPGTFVAGGNMLYGFAAGQGGSNPPGTWRCHGDVSAGGRTVFQRVS
jgi:hypothetical protein